tara:strand:- start:762 stop:971 length:210 start_codon:yes stop_codon:yes gene_type:complete
MTKLKGKLWNLKNTKIPKKNPINQEHKKYTVWVGGTEVTEHFVKYSKAKSILDNYKGMGYTDAIIQEGR